MFRLPDKSNAAEGIPDFLPPARFASGVVSATRGDGVNFSLSGAIEKTHEFPVEADEGIELRRGAYERDLIQSVWEFAEIVPGNDPSLWRKDEFGSWIHRLEYSRRGSEFGWEIFDPGVGRHAQGVYAMRPMQWENYIHQYETFA